MGLALSDSLRTDGRGQRAFLDEKGARHTALLAQRDC
jgi:hypothetical protein